MKISKRTREQAAMALATCASADVNAKEWGACYQAVALLDLSDHESAYSLAFAAWRYVSHSGRLGLVDYQERKRTEYAEAEALLRTGWTP